MTLGRRRIPFLVARYAFVPYFVGKIVQTLGDASIGERFPGKGSPASEGMGIDSIKGVANVSSYRRRDRVSACSEKLKRIDSRGRMVARGKLRGTLMASRETRMG